MTVQFFSPEIFTFDTNKNDTIVLSFFSDERPLKGIKGLLDWRMNGRISRFVIEGKITGRFGESIIMPSQNRISANKICLFGLGKLELFSIVHFKEIISLIIGKLKKLKVTSFSFPLPGSPLFNLNSKERAQILMEQVFKSYEYPLLKELNIGIIEDHMIQREISDVINSFIRSLSPSNIRIL